MFVPYKLKVSAVAVAMALASAGFSAHAVLKRAGPVSTDPAVGFFPSWYQDTTGITTEFCAPNQAEADGGWCLLLATDVTVPEAFPAPFFDEHFYFAASAQIATRQQGQKAILVMAEEAAFANGAPKAGDQITFSRIRVVLNPVPVTGKYRFIHPYGEELVDGVAGDRIFFTNDVGSTCVGNFDCSLTSRLGPFLLPTTVYGNPNALPPVTAGNPTPDTDPTHFGGAPLTTTAYPGTGKAYIADPARIGPVTGSPLPNFIDSTNASRNHNIFRIEGPAGSALGGTDAAGNPIDWIETTDFSLMGRLYDGTVPGVVSVNRASYRKDVPSATSQLDVFATAIPNTPSRLPGQAIPAEVNPSLSFYAAPCAGAIDPVTSLVVPPYSAPAGVATPMKSAASLQWGQLLQPAAIPSAVCVRDASAVDVNGVVTPVFMQATVTDEVNVTKAFFDPNAGTLAAAANSSDTAADVTLDLAYATVRVPLTGTDPATGDKTVTVSGLIVPPAKADVASNKLGITNYQVSTGYVTATPSVPTAANDTGTVAMNTFDPITNTGVATSVNLAVLANDVVNGTPSQVFVTAQPLHGTAVVNADNTVTYAPAQYWSGTDSFQYSVQVGTAPNIVNSNNAQATLTVTPVNVAPTANPDTFSAIAGVAIDLDVLANDTDPNGTANIDVPVITVGSISAGANAAVNANKKVAFSAAAAGNYTFRYRAQDLGIVGAGGPALSNETTVSVSVVAAETVAFTRQDYIRSSSRLRVDGTVSTGANRLITVDFVIPACGACNPSRPNVTFSRAGTATSIAGGTWSLDVPGIALPDPSVVSVRATPPQGAPSFVNLNIK